MERFSIPGVGGIIEKEIEGKDCILVQRRCKGDSYDKFGLIEIPAGKIREFENIFSCLRREIKEETGLDVIEIIGEEESIVVDRNNYRVINFQPFACSQNIRGEYPIMVLTFICKAMGDLLNKSDESEELQWIELNKLKEELNINEDEFYPMHISTLKKYLRYRGY